MTEEQVESWDHLAEGPKREHVATAAEREHLSNTCYLKQTTAGGAGTFTTAKHPDLHKAEQWHRERVRRQRDTTPT